MATPLVSIIMPLYNKRSYVKRAIDSVRQQTFTNLELIIIDDGSTDGSVDEIPRDDSRIRLYRQANAGPAAARNYGIRMASGELVTFLDADDYYYASKLEVETTYLFQEKRADWMMSAFEYETNESLIFRPFRAVDGKEVGTLPMVFNRPIMRLQIRGWHINGLCIRKSLLERVEGFREEMRCFEITEFFIRCALTEPKLLIYPAALYRVVDVVNSAYKVSLQRIEGKRAMGESLHKLALNYPEYSDILIQKSRKALLAYALGLLLSDQRVSARSYLVNNYHYPRDKEWWRLWLKSWFPKSLFSVKQKLERLRHIC